jgi:hypothetical protein
MTEHKSIPLQKFLSNIKQKGYSYTKVYAQGPEVKFIQLYSNLQRKPFLLQVPSQFVIYSTATDHMLDLVENDYRNFRQREYLNKINLHDAACLSECNLSVKDGTEFSCYLIDSIPDALSEDEIEDLEDLGKEEDFSSSDSDIEIDDYPVEDIYPVFNMASFIKNLDDFEETVLEHYSAITEAEEEMNETEVEKLLQTFDNQKTQLKDRIFSIHKNAYNTRRDIAKCGDNLKRIYLLKEQSTVERDRVRFKIERLEVDTEEKIDALNEKLREQRNQADVLLQKYRTFIERFDLIE